ncbi:MAG: DUF5906 domain-containing protein [Clostridiales bacterium]|nr:DUF5906 domain-containing protein [Clostridiales bacterium]
MHKEDSNEENFRKDHLEYDNNIGNTHTDEDNFRKDHLEYYNDMGNDHGDEENFRKDHLEYDNDIGDPDKTERWFQEDFLGNKNADKGETGKKPKKKFKYKKYLQGNGFKGSNFRCDHLAYDNPELSKQSQSKKHKKFEEDAAESWLKAFAKQNKESDNRKAANAKEVPAEASVHNNSGRDDNISDCSSNSSEQKSTKPERELVALATKIAEKVKVISHNNGVYYYDGKTYRLIADENSLLRLVLKKVDASAFRAHATKMFKDIYATIKADERFEPEDYRRKLRESKHLIAFNNCLFNIKTGEKLAFSEEYLTFGAYDAVYRDNPYPKQFLDCIEDWSGGNPEIKQRILQATGYLLMHTNDGKIFFVLGTAPNSGKSVYGKLLEYLVGDEQVCYLTPEALQGRFGLGYIQGKTICMNMDLPKGNFTAQTASIIKQISGGDKIFSEQKYERPQNIRSDLRFVFSSNFPVKVAKSCDDKAFWNRMVIVPFLNEIPEAATNKQLFDDLADEKDDIISYCLNTACELIENNYIFDHCQVAVEMKELWRNGAVDITGSIEEFANTCIDFTGDSSDFIHTQTLYGLYEEFCRQMKLPKVSYNDLRDWFVKSGCIAKRIHNSRSENAKASLCGIKIKGGITIDQ